MMRIILICFVLLALLGVGGVAFIALNPPREAVVAEAPAQVTGASFVVTNRALRAGSMIRAEDLAAAELDVALAPPGAQRDSREARLQLAGSMLRRSLATGETIRGDDVMRTSERGFLAAVLGADMRAFSISVDAVTGTAGLIWPGDRVDLLLSQQLNDEAVPIFRRILAETVLTDVRVIAIDQALVQGAMGEGPELNRQSRTVTLEVSSRQAELAAVATRLGRLSLIVRSATDSVRATDTGSSDVRLGKAGSAYSNGTQASLLPEQPTPLFGGDVSPGLRNGRPTSAPPQTLHIFSGGNRREEFRF